MAETKRRCPNCNRYTLFNRLEAQHCSRHSSRHSSRLCCSDCLIIMEADGTLARSERGSSRVGRHVAIVNSTISAAPRTLPIISSGRSPLASFERSRKLQLRMDPPVLEEMRVEKMAWPVVPSESESGRASQHASELKPELAAELVERSRKRPDVSDVSTESSKLPNLPPFLTSSPPPSAPPPMPPPHILMHREAYIQTQRKFQRQESTQLMRAMRSLGLGVSARAVHDALETPSSRSDRGDCLVATRAMGEGEDISADLLRRRSILGEIQFRRREAEAGRFGKGADEGESRASGGEPIFPICHIPFFPYISGYSYILAFSLSLSHVGRCV